jgi:hypothetical protein
MELTPPQFFMLTMTHLLGSSQRLARECWRYYPASTELVFQLGLCSGQAPSPTIAMERMRHAARLLSPQLLIRSLERLAAERGRHSTEARRVEERILQLVDREGQWVWYNQDKKDTYGQRRIAGATAHSPS